MVLLLNLTVTIFHMQLKPDIKHMKLVSYIAHYYAISGVPGDNIKAPTGKDYRVFLQSTTQKLKDLKKGSWLLYKVLINLYQ